MVISRGQWVILRAGRGPASRDGTSGTAAASDKRDPSRVTFGRPRSANGRVWLRGQDATPLQRRVRSRRLCRALQQAFCLCLQFKAPVLMRFRTGMGGQTLHEIKDTFRRATFLAQHGLDDPAGFRL